MAESHRVPGKLYRNEDKEHGILQKYTNPDRCSDNGHLFMAKKNSDTMANYEQPQIMSIGIAEV